MNQPPPGGAAEIALARGEAFAGGGNRPIELSDPETVWYVVRGAVDVFVAQRSGDEAASDYQQLLRVRPGRMLFGIAREEGVSEVCIARGLPGAELRRVPRAAFADPRAAEPLAGQVDAWIVDFAAAIARKVTPRPRPERFLTAGEETGVVRESVLATRRGVVWVSCPAGGAALFGTGEPAGGGPGFLPVTADGWISLFRPARLTTASSAALDARGLLLPALAEFHRLALSAHALNRRLLLVDTANLQRTQALHRRRSEERARHGLFSVLDAGRAPVEEQEEAVLPAALERIGRHEGIRFRLPPRRRRTGDGASDLAAIQRASGVRARRIRLAAGDRWWLGDSGALLAFRRGSGHPVALIPGASGRYRLFDPGTGRPERIDARLARELASEAYFFYRPLPPDEAVRSAALFRFAFRGLGGALARFALAGLLAGLLMLAPPVLLGALVDRVIPSGSGWQLLQASLSLVLLAVLAAFLQALQGTALMRLEALSAARVGAALWDRMLGLPRRFFRRFSTGDLAVRAMAFQDLRDLLSGVVGNALLAVIFLLPTFVLLFLYDTRIGWLGLGLGLFSLGVTLVVGILQLPLHQRLFAISRRLAGKLLQLLNGVGKLRTTGSEGIGFAVWATGYREQKQIEMRIGGLDWHLIAFLSAAPLLAAAAVFAVAAPGGSPAVPTGDFLTLYAAFMVFYAAVARLGGSFSAVAAILPAFRQAEPILEAAPGTGPAGEPPPEPSGDVRLDHVSFRYAEDGPLVLRDVSIHARAGEFVAVVGESGAGKSTLFRLALGLEAPASGAVYYDGRDLGRLDARAVRSRIGMVAQDASLQPGTVLENIIGLSGDLTEEDAWRAARLAAVDEDVAAMPMRMQTIAGDGSPLFSGGQIQRILLAAALVRDPSVLFLDEATNWLDNRSQAQVMERLAELAVTRFVSAHRLSTIRLADSIHVLQDGRVAQTGTFDELAETEGPFRELVRRQMA